jgi:hypothetical protein
MPLCHPENLNYEKWVRNIWAKTISSKKTSRQSNMPAYLKRKAKDPDALIPKITAFGIQNLKPKIRHHNFCALVFNFHAYLERKIQISLSPLDLAQGSFP